MRCNVPRAKRRFASERFSFRSSRQSSQVAALQVDILDKEALLFFTGSSESRVSNTTYNFNMLPIAASVKSDEMAKVARVY